jgi:hypothetical protein
LTLLPVLFLLKTESIPEAAKNPRSSKPSFLGKEFVQFRSFAGREIRRLEVFLTPEKKLGVSRAFEWRGLLKLLPSNFEEFTRARIDRFSDPSARA